MKVKWLSGLIAAAVMLMCSVSFASPFVDDGVLAVAPTIETNSYTANDPPLAPAAKPNSDGIDTGSGRRISIAYFQLKTDNMIPRTVLACGYSDIPKDKPYKVPIAV